MANKKEVDGLTTDGPQTERGRARRRKIIEVARRMFEERGANVSLSEIVKEAGGSLATVYKWFGGKEELFFAVFLYHLDNVKAAIDSTRLDGPTVQDDIETIVEGITSRIPFQLIRVAVFESNIFKKFKKNALASIEANTNEPIARLFSRIRRERGVEFILSDEELALIYARFFRGVMVELALDADDVAERLASGKRELKVVFNSLIQTNEGARS